MSSEDESDTSKKPTTTNELKDESEENLFKKNDKKKKSVSSYHGFDDSSISFIGKDKSKPKKKKDKKLKSIFVKANVPNNSSEGLMNSRYIINKEDIVENSRSIFLQVSSSIKLDAFKLDKVDDDLPSISKDPAVWVEAAKFFDEIINCYVFIKTYGELDNKGKFKSKNLSSNYLLTNMNISNDIKKDLIGGTYNNGKDKKYKRYNFIKESLLKSKGVLDKVTGLGDIFAPNIRILKYNGLVLFYGKHEELDGYLINTKMKEAYMSCLAKDNINSIKEIVPKILGQIKGDITKKTKDKFKPNNFSSLLYSLLDKSKLTNRIFTKGRGKTTRISLRVFIKKIPRYFIEMSRQLDVLNPAIRHNIAAPMYVNGIENFFSFDILSVLMDKNSLRVCQVKLALSIIRNFQAYEKTDNMRDKARKRTLINCCNKIKRYPIDEDALNQLLNLEDQMLGNSAETNRFLSLFRKVDIDFYKKRLR